MTIRKNNRKLVSMLLAILFTIGIMGNQSFEDWNLSAFRGIAAADSVIRQDSESKAGAKGLAKFGLTAARILQDIDDFQVTSDTGNSHTDARQQLRTAQLLFLAKDTEHTAIPRLPELFWNGEKRIRLFQVIAFIHQTDGKKKSCFA